VVSSISLTAQNKDTKIADKLFGQFEYVQATKEYLSLKMEITDSYVYKQLAIVISIWLIL
jgi:hypothetical protein